MREFQQRRLVKIVLLVYKAISSIAVFLVAVFTFIFILKGCSKDVYVECSPRVQLGHEWGDVVIGQAFSIKNVGGKLANVKKIQGFMRCISPDGAVLMKTRLEPVSYLNVTNHLWMPFMGVSIDEDETLTLLLRFKPPYNRNTYDSIPILQSILFKDALDSSNKNISVNEANVSTGERIIKFINSRIANIKSGRYEYYVQVSDDDDRVVFERCYKFLVTDATIDYFNKLTQGYLQLPTQKELPEPNPLIILLDPIENAEIQKELQAEIRKI